MQEKHRSGQTGGADIEPTRDRKAERLSASVVICAHDEARWPMTRAAVASVLAQSRPPDEVLLVIDHHERLLARAREAYPQLSVMANRERPGLSGARNTGVEQASGDIVAFLDDDARAQPDWLALLLAAYRDPAVVGAGGATDPDWEGEPPRWLPGEFLWSVGCGYVGMPVRTMSVRNPFGGNASFRRDAILEAGGFTDGIGRIDSKPLGCEETDLSIRIRERRPDSIVLFEPRARILHHVPATRTTFRYVTARCFAEGISKAAVARNTNAAAALATERAYVRRTLPRGLLRELRELARGDAAAALRAAGLAIGLAATALGYAIGRFAAITGRLRAA